MSPSAERSLENFDRALAALEDAVALPVAEDRDIGGIIKAFELTYETAWKALKRRLADEGRDTTTPREAFSIGFSIGWLSNEGSWLGMIRDRNLTVHTYNRDLAHELLSHIMTSYVPAFLELHTRLHQPID